MNVAHEKHAAGQTRQQSINLSAIEASMVARTFESIEQPRLVTLGLQASEPPRADVREALVVQINRVLRGKHHTHASCSSLLQQRKQRQLRRRIRGRREVAEDLVHVDECPQTCGARLPAHPARNGVQQQRHEEHALGVVQMRDREDGHARLA